MLVLDCQTNSLGMSIIEHFVTYILHEENTNSYNIIVHSTHLLHLHPDSILQWAGDSSWVSLECSTTAESYVTHLPWNHGLEQLLDLQCM